MKINIKYFQHSFLFFIFFVFLFFLGTSFPSKWNTANAILTAVGIILTLVLTAYTTKGISIGEMYILLSALCYTGSLLITKKYLSDVV